jgi:beta-lactamase class A
MCTEGDLSDLGGVGDNLGEVSAEAVFQAAKCLGQLCVQPLDGSPGVDICADQLVVSASVVKVPIAVEVETQLADGRLDPRGRVILTAADRSPGPVGFSLYQDDVDVSIRDLVVAMLTISDNPATDALLQIVGLDAVNERMTHLGLTSSVVVSGEREIVDSIGRDAGLANWKALVEWSRQPRSAAEQHEMDRRIYTDSTALLPERTTRTTARDMATLLRLIWTDQAGPAAACRRVRQLMGQQLTKHRLASAFRAPVRVSAKSGGLIGVVRNEIGVVEFPDGRGYAVAVFTQTPGGAAAGGADAEVNRAIGAAAAEAIGSLR